MRMRTAHLGRKTSIGARPVRDDLLGFASRRNELLLPPTLPADVCGIAIILPSTPVADLTEETTRGGLDEGGHRP